jgi:hypothetical protein
VLISCYNVFSFVGYELVLYSRPHPQTKEISNELVPLIKLKLLNFHDYVVSVPDPENTTPGWSRKNLKGEYFNISPDWLARIEAEGEDVYSDRFLTPKALNTWVASLKDDFLNFHPTPPASLESNFFSFSFHSRPLALASSSNIRPFSSSSSLPANTF